uniref:Uncharacterized protein n=1 Tax=Electrophorus electricus TaxID=8005 RepID=A0AAY5ECI4_ELEEL
MVHAQAAYEGPVQIPKQLLLPLTLVSPELPSHAALLLQSLLLHQTITVWELALGDSKPPVMKQILLFPLGDKQSQTTADLSRLGPPWSQRGARGSPRPSPTGLREQGPKCRSLQGPDTPALVEQAGSAQKCSWHWQL